MVRADFSSEDSHMEPGIDTKIFSPAKIAGLELKNRIIRSGCFEGMAFEGSPSDKFIRLHRDLAEGGVAMTTVAYCSVSKLGRAYAHELWMREEIVRDLKRLTDAVHDAGARASIQLGHCGFFADRK